MKKKLSLLSAALLLIGAGCTAPTDVPSAAPAPDVPNAVVPTPVPAPAPADRPSGGAIQPKPPQGGSGSGQDLEAEPSANVSILAGGTFSPAVLNVKQGETVTWTNVGDAVVWVASDPHPAHTGYPGFDSKTAVSKGASYSFTFTKPGSWGYHNHYDPRMKGTVVVE